MVPFVQVEAGLFLKSYKRLHNGNKAPLICSEDRMAKEPREQIPAEQCDNEVVFAIAGTANVF